MSGTLCVCFIGVCVALCVRAIKAMLSSPFLMQCMLPSRLIHLLDLGREILYNALQCHKKWAHHGTLKVSTANSDCRAHSQSQLRN
jgi:hypothetical protein